MSKSFATLSCLQVHLKVRPDIRISNACPRTALGLNQALEAYQNLIDPSFW